MQSVTNSPLYTYYSAKLRDLTYAHSLVCLHILTKTGYITKSIPMLAESIEEAVQLVKADNCLFQHTRWAITRNPPNVPINNNTLEFKLSPFLKHWKFRTVFRMFSASWRHERLVRQYGSIL
jgi:hypothetical protein